MQPHDLLIRCLPARFDLDDLVGILNRHRQLASLSAERREAVQPPDQDRSEPLPLPFDPRRLLLLEERTRGDHRRDVGIAPRRSSVAPPVGPFSLVNRVAGGLDVQPCICRNAKTTLQDHPLSVAGRHGVTAPAEFAPEATAGLHVHPGEEFGYVIEGEVELSVEGRSPVTLQKGDVFFIPAVAIQVR